MLADRYDEAKRLAYEYSDLFGKKNFFLELQNHGLDADGKVLPHIHRLAGDTGIPLVATNDSHYLRQDDARAHEILLCIQTGKTMSDPNRMRFTEPAFYLKSREEMMELFGEVPEALDRTWDIAQRCQLKIEPVTEPFPKFPIPEAHTTDTYFEYVARQGFEKRRPRLEALPCAGPPKARSGGVRRAPGPRNPHHPADEVFRIFPDRLGSHPLREGAQNSRRPGARIGRRQPG